MREMYLLERFFVHEVESVLVGIEELIGTPFDLYGLYLRAGGEINYFERAREALNVDYLLYYPAISPSELRRWGSIGDDDSWERYCSYHLAYTKDVTAKVPTWHSLDHRMLQGTAVFSGGSGSYYYFTTEESSSTMDNTVFGYMGYVDPGDYMTFDVKFWAPYEGESGGSVGFTFCVEAATFPLWDHGQAVE